jgi:alpha-beta hydrolase superfamily lysophospholipase
MARVAAALGADGMMTLRFDKYGSGQTGIGTFWSHPQDLDYPAVLRQAVAAYAALRAQPEANPAALSLVGHSEGGLTAMLVAQQVSPRPAGIALLAPQSLRLLNHIQAQIGRQLAAAVRARQLTTARQRQITAAMVRAVADLRAHRPVDPARLPAELTGIFTILQGVNLRYTFSDDALDPAVVARRVPAGIRALLACGGADEQVTCADTTGIVTAWRGRTTGQGRLALPGVDHFLSVPARQFVLAPSVLVALHDFAAPGPRPAVS